MRASTLLKVFILGTSAVITMETRIYLPDAQLGVRIEDDGQGFEWHKYVDMDLERAFDTHGRGIAMSRMISFDDVQYLGVGNKVEVTVRLEKQEEQDTPAAMIA